jgi:hypothetical protein
MTNAEGRWGACPQGELSRLGARLRGRRRRRIAVRAGGALAVLLTCVGLWTLIARPRDNTFAGITCTRVTELAIAYGERTLEPDLRTQVSSHVEQCPRCHKRFKAMRLIARLMAERWILPAGVAFDMVRETPDAHVYPPASG